jgi:hypothetical protein
MPQFEISSDFPAALFRWAFAQVDQLNNVRHGHALGNETGSHGGRCGT